MAKFKTKRALILSRRDEYGTADLKRRVMIRCTYLYREVMLRLNARRITEEYYCLKEKGMFAWEAYGKHKEASKNHLILFDMLLQGTKIVV